MFTIFVLIGLQLNVSNKEKIIDNIINYFIALDIDLSAFENKKDNPIICTDYNVFIFYGWSRYVLLIHSLYLK